MLANSPLFKPVVFLLCLSPLLWLGGRAAAGHLGANPVETVIHVTGLWGLRFLILVLAVSPVQRVWPRLGLVRLRRMLGLFAFAYVTLHLLAYVGLEHFFDWPAIGRDILERLYITVGLTAFVLMVPLALTSTRGMVRRLGRNWRRLHRLIYIIVPLGVLHFLLQVKADWREPAFYGFLVAVLLLLRFRGKSRSGGS